MSSKVLLAAFAALSALFIGFLWWMYFSSAGATPLWLPLLGTALPFVIAGVVWGVQLWTARRASRALESALEEDGARERREAPDGRGVEIDRLRGEFERAVKALKSSKLANGSRRAGDALYRLPWYAIIGPPGSGKTTVLRNSGLKFPYLPGTGDRLKGIGGTRNCDWWLTNQAILLDTAGRWSIEERERDEWLAFLELLKKHRRDRPLNGIIAAISVAGDDATSIMSSAEDDLREIALRMRERLDEITGRLGVELPVYLMFTKCDLINGFVETFGDLSGERRKQIWGFTAPVLQGARRDPGGYFAQQFDLLREELEQRAVVRMGAEVDQRTIPLIYEFPAQFSALKDKLTFFVDELFDASAYRETPLLRGVYFTSGTQEGAPADLLFEHIAGALELRPPTYERREDEQKSYFLHDMLMRVVFEDRALATTSEGELVRQHWRRRAVSSALFASALVGTLLATDACQHNLHAIEHTETSFAGNQAARIKNEGSAQRRPEQVAELLALEHDMARYERGGRGVRDLGLDQSGRISPALERYYRNALAEAIVRPLLERNQGVLLTRTQQLRAAAGTAQSNTLDQGARDELRDALSLQLLLAGPPESCTPKPMARKDFVVGRLLALWDSSGATDGASAEDRKLLLARYLELGNHAESDTAAAQAMDLGHDPRAVEQARRALGADDPVMRLLTRVIASHPTQPKGLTDLTGPTTALQGQNTVPGAFTREAWTQIGLEVDSDHFRESEGDWVFGCGDNKHDEARAEQDLTAFREGYLERYRASWRELVEGLNGRAPANSADAEGMLSELVSRPGTLGRLFEQVQVNTSLPLPATTSSGPNAVEKAGAGALALAKKSAETMAREGNRVSSYTVKDTLTREGLVALSGAPPANNAGGPARPNAPALAQPLADDFAGFHGFAQGNGGASGLDQYRKLLEPVLVALKAYRQDESKIEALATAAQGALESTDLLLRSQNPAWSGRLRDLLVPVLAGTLDLVQRGHGSQLGRSYCDAVYLPFQRELAGRYPFKPDSREPASLAAFTRFFQPGSGSLWAFQSAHLARYVTSEGGRFRFTGSQAKSVLRDDLLDFLQRSAAIAQAFFPDGSGGPRVRYKVRVRGAPGYTVTTFRAGSRSVQYDSGAESWVPLEWPSDESNPGVSLAVTPYQGPAPRPHSFDNPWGLFMILQPDAGAQVFERSRSGLSVGWRPKAAQNFVKVDFASDDPRSPLLAAPFAEHGKLFPLVVPARVSQLGASCSGGGR
ncbi:MAG: type VI secretion system membrane subunit TssM [Polyangiales bacterium]